ncbi:hypothetical protein AC579_8761 [Pseudocercospora musae]|uniref:Uncharacterized protein n=1 Tax=Pseudocercospora musae TaxID=113226 RepID=A0A139IWF6_9PEZI|nr:hypothetical protein AC579_8761 [Pseudocercospora musae]
MSLSILTWNVLHILLVLALVLLLCRITYSLVFDPLRKIPGHYLAKCSSLWLRYQRWHGRLSLTADALLTKYNSSILRLSPDLVLINDPEAVEKAFVRKDLDTSPTSIRALKVGGHDWTVTYPQHGIARQRRHPVMIASTTKNLRAWHNVWRDNVRNMVADIDKSQGKSSEDIVRHLRICTLKCSQVVIGGPGVQLKTEAFPRIVGEYNFLVVWRLCLPEWTFEWLKHFPPPQHAWYRVRSSDMLFDLGAEICRQAQANQGLEAPNGAPNVYDLCIDPDAKYPAQSWSQSELGAEMAGQILAATETTSSALAFIYYELAKNSTLQQELYQELMSADTDEELDSLKLLDACIKEGLRFRPPVALTGSRLVPQGGLEVCGHYLPEGTVITTQSLSMSRQRPDLFPDYDTYNAHRWLQEDGKSAERKHLLVPFGVGSRRCPGGNMALYLMRMILYHTIRAFDIRVAPETTPEKMEPFEANGYRSRHDRCDLMFLPRARGSAR